MATRLYFANNKGTPGITPAVASGWENTSAGFGRYQAITTGTTDSSNDTPGAVGSGVANEDTVVFQLVYGPLTAGSFNGTTDTFKGQAAPRAASGSTDARAQVTVRMMAPDGTTTRFTALAMDTAALSSEFNIDVSTRINRKFPRGGANTLSAGSWSDGDYAVIEIGFRNHGTNTSAVRMGSGADTSDYPEDETTSAGSGTSGRPWFEFSKTLSPYTGAAGGTTSLTVTARSATTTIKPTTGTTSATVTARDATVSYLTPPRTVLINSIDYTSVIRLDSYSFTECANNGEVGIGGVDVFDSASALDIPALKAGVFDDPAAGQSNKRVWTGFTHDRTTERGVQKVAGVREWGVELADLNTLFDDFVLTAAESADRPAETDYARMVWLLTTGLGTTGLVGSGVVPNSNTVNMEATDYRGRRARAVASECLEASGKLCFIYDYGAGRKLYYDVATGTSLSSSAKISDVATDVDSSTVWAPYSPPVVKRSPDRIYSKVHLTYTGGTVTVSNATTASNYRVREAAVQDMSITTSALATIKANALLTGAATELLEISNVAIAVPAANVNDIRQGQRVQIKLTRHGISSYTYYRVTRRTITPLGDSNGVSDVHYLVTMTLASDVLASANGGRGADDIPQNRSNSNDDGATVIIDRGGITVTDGAITVTNAGAIVIIDGSSDMFKIAATGTLSVTLPGDGTDPNDAIDSVTLTSLGTWSLPPAMHAMLTSYSGDTTQPRYMGGLWGASANTTKFASLTSGGAVNSKLLATTSFATVTSVLNGSAIAVINLVAIGITGDTSAFYARYFVLQEASI